MSANRTTTRTHTSARISKFSMLFIAAICLFAVSGQAAVNKPKSTILSPVEQIMTDEFKDEQTAIQQLYKQLLSHPVLSDT